MKGFAYLVLVFVACLSACKKEHPAGLSTIDQVKDSIFYYEQEDYLWNDALPTYSSFHPRGYEADNDKDALTKELNAISQFKINPATGLPFEYDVFNHGYAKYSFVDDGTETASLNGTNGDFGFEPEYIATSDLRVKYVYAGSPAGLAGIKRGYEILSINNNQNIEYDDGPNVNFVINTVYYSSSITLGLQKPDGKDTTITLATASYTVNPVLTYQVYNRGGGHTVGYIAFNSFTTPTHAEPQLNTAFNYFISHGVNDLVIDLRYNGGGDGRTAEYLDDLVAPASKSGSLMYTQYFNAGLQANHYPLLAKKYAISPGDFLPQNNRAYFKKALSLNLNRVFFIVTGATASSSELTINNLRPALSVQLIGDTTYGKPVGEIPIPIKNYTLFSPQLYVENSAGQGDYYSGMAPGSAAYPGLLAQDDITKDFGDTTEMLLSHALHFVTSGVYSANIPHNPGAQKVLTLHQARVMALKMETPHKFRAMVFKK